MTPARLFRTLKSDAIELMSARAITGRRSLLRAILMTDSFRIVVLQRAREFARELHMPLVPHLLRVTQTTLLGVEIGPKVTLGRGVYFVHPLGVVIGGDAKIGDRVRFYGSNTVGTGKDNGYPTIEEDVWIGAGARILGPITIGARSRIGANAVVVCDVPPDSVALGIPARITPRRDGPAK